MVSNYGDLSMKGYKKLWEKKKIFVGVFKDVFSGLLKHGIVQEFKLSSFLSPFNSSISVPKNTLFCGLPFQFAKNTRQYRCHVLHTQ